MTAPARGTLAGMAMTVGLVAGCLGGGTAPGPQPTADLEIIWDVSGSTADGGLGSYFDTPSSPLLHAGPVFVAWECTGTGTLPIRPGLVNPPRPPHVPPSDTPLAFRIACPSFGPGLTDWIKLPSQALGGENMLYVAYPASAPNIQYRIVVAQPRVGASP